MSDEVVRSVKPLGPSPSPWETSDPFLFAVHHHDHYPAGNEKMGPTASLAGRNMGQDFANKDGWNMYHGQTVPGFPQHPHRGFETVTIVRNGYIDHSDSLGATARFGEGDVQWLTAGKGIVHSEMFPLVNRDAPNPTELFQIWLNLPRAGKMVEPHFKMLWSDDIPRRTFRDPEGRVTEVNVIAGTLGDGASPPSPPPSSWASQEGADVAIFTIRMEPHASWTLPAAVKGSNRRLYFFEGKSLQLSGMEVGLSNIELVEDRDVLLVNGAEPADLLLLQGRPIGEPVVAYGPFVMNTPEEVQQTFAEYRRTQFGGWPFPEDAPTHPRVQGRFARHADGQVEERERY